MIGGDGEEPCLGRRVVGDDGAETEGLGIPWPEDEGIDRCLAEVVIGSVNEENFGDLEII